MNELITLVANLALTLSFIVALVFGIAQVRTAASDRRERLTLEALRNFQTREFAELALYVNSRTLPVNRKEMNALPIEEQAMLFQYGQEMEGLGIMVAEGLINLDLVDKTLGSFVMTTWEKYKPLFTDIREKQPDPYMGEYFQWLAERINERMRDQPREPFYKNGALVKAGR
ncbi:MAG: hypothetical protein JSS82_19670 [Bacteroidetes bacterium]|nr:hypothetical protein [Bacteroidota bacterium]